MWKAAANIRWEKRFWLKPITRVCKSAAPEAFQAEVGHGVSAEVEGQHILVGNQRLMQKFNLDDSHWTADVARLQAEGKTAMLVAVDDAVRGVIAVADTLKEDAISGG